MMKETPSTHRRLSRAAFTLIEMLVVIAIIALLAGILVPAVNRSITRANEAKARSEAQNIEAAVMLFFNEYGQLPIQNGDHGNADNTISTTFSKNVLMLLMGLDSTGGNGFADNAGFALNPKETVFLNTDSPSTDGTYLDPWGVQYEIILDMNYDNSIIYPAATTPHRKKVVVVSAGPDMDMATLDDNVANVAVEIPVTP